MSPRPISKLFPLLLVLLFFVPGQARASAFDTFGVESRVQALGLTGVVCTQSAGALFYNPAAMAFLPKGTIMMEFSHGVSEVDVRLAPRPSGYDPEAYGTRLAARADNTKLPSLFGISIGTTNNFGLSWLTGGLLFFLPASGVGAQKTWFVDEREQYFSNGVRMELLGERQQTQLFYGGLAVRPLDFLALGFSVSLMPMSKTTNDAYSPNPTDPSDLDLNLSVRQEAGLALTGSVMLVPYEWLKVAAVYRQAQYYGLSGANVVQVKGSEDTDDYPLYQPMDVAIHYSPSTLSVGASVELGRLGVYTDATWVQWSSYRTAHNEAVDFDDIWELGLGLELLNGRDVVRLGGRYVPSPVPAQTGRSNLADNDRWLLTMGWGRAIKVLGAETQLDLHLQAHLLPQRTNTKSGQWAATCEDGGLLGPICDEDPDTAGLQTGNPGFPGFSSGGFMIQGGGTLTWLF
jgi:hypothetical protein